MNGQTRIGLGTFSYVVVDTVRFWPKWRSLLLSSDSSAAFLPLKEESHIVIRALGKQDVRRLMRSNPAKGYIWFYIYIYNFGWN